MKASIGVLLGLLVGCGGSQETNAYTKIARAVNGSLRALRPTALEIQRLRSAKDAASMTAVVGMCTSMDTALRIIADEQAAFRRLDDGKGSPDSTVTDAPDNARWLLEDRRLMCKERGAYDLGRCHDFCVSRWSQLASSIESLRSRAAAHGAHLESLKVVD